MISIFVSSNTHVESASAYTASITTSSSVTLDATATGDGTSIHSESINIASDCRSGYNLTIATTESSNLYKDGNSSNGVAFTSVDGTSALSSNNNTNKWGYTITSNPTSSTIFSPLSTTASTIKTPSETASPSSDINDTFSINYGTKVDNTIAPGSYQMTNNGAIIYYLTMDTTCTQYTVSFNPNGGTVTSGGNNPTQNIGEGSHTKLDSSTMLTAPTTSTYTDAGNNTIVGDSDKLWTFWGWNTNIDGTGDWYKDKEEVTDLTTAGSTITLYAQWKQATLADMTAGTQIGTEKVIDHNLVQDMSPETCYNSNAFSTDTNSDAHNPYDSSTSPNGYHTITLLDYRGKVITDDPNTTEQPEQYTVSKLADGLCWMTTNLNLGRASGGENNDGTITLTSEDTDLADNTTFTLPAGDTTAYTATTNLAKVRLTNNSGNSDNGAYYTWAAAVANTTSINTNPTTSICPKNWDLSSGSQYANLSTKSSYGSTNQTTAVPSSFLIDGGFTNGDTFYQTSYSHFWTNTSSSTSTTTAYGARIEIASITITSNTGTGFGGNKYYRKNLRCVASQGKVTINYSGNNNDGGSTASQENVEINSTDIRINGFTRTHYSFKNWNTEPDGSGTAINNSAALSALNLKPGDIITLYAQWTPQRQIIYNDNCSYNNAGCATNEDTTGTSNWTNAGSSFTLAANDYYIATRPGYAITSWNTARDGSGTSYNPSTSYTVPPNLSSPDQVTLYAQWSPALTINFNSNGGSGTMTSQLIPENTSKALKSNSFSAPSGNYFIGWMTEESRATNTVVYTNGATFVAPTSVTPSDSITLYAKWGPRYTIVYNGNNATGGSMVSGGTELKHNSINEGNNVNLYAPNYYKTNYGFVGWSPSPTATVGGTDPIYGPNETISAPDYALYGQLVNGTKTVTLYAIWLEADSTKTMQTFGLADCQNMAQTTYNPTTGTITAPAGSVIALKDQRDNNVYTVARLADGNCWMTENLRLEAAGTVGNNQFDSSVTNESLSQGYGGVFVGLDTSEDTNFDSVITATPNNLYNISNITGDYKLYRVPRYNNNNTNTNLMASYNGTGSNTYYSWYSYGNYYTWAAAMANTTYYSSATGASGSESAGTSICPTNWTLPTSGGVSKDFGTLSRRYGGTGSRQISTEAGDVMSKRFRSFPNNFLYSGSFGGSSASYRGSRGNYWSRSVGNTTTSSYLYISSDALYPSGYNAGYQYQGRSIRCLLDNYSYAIKYDGNGATDGSMISNGVELKNGNLLGGETIHLYPSNYSKTGYGFAGWSLDNDAATKLASGAQVKVYGPNEIVTIDNAFLANADANNKITLYAVWLPADPNYTLQTFGSTQCSAMNIGDVTALSDTRDSNTYTVAKLEDGNCWTVENLRLDPSTTTFTSSNTNYPTQAFIDAAPLSSTNNTLCNDDTAACVDTIRFNTNNINRSNTASYNSNTIDKSWYSYGVMYNWYTASAGNGDFAMGTGNVAGDICPAGWRLPTSGSNSEYTEINRLANNGSTTDAAGLLKFPDNFILSGDYNHDKPGGRNSYTRLWSATPDNSSTTPDGTLKAFRFGFNYYGANNANNIVTPMGSWGKWDAFAVRCIAK